MALIPASLLVTAVRRPRYALLTTTWLVMTGWFAVSYTNADIERYYLGPILIVVSWLAIAADGLVEALEAWLVVQPNAGRRVGEARCLLAAVVVCGTLVAPAVLAAPTTRLVVDQSTDTSATGWSRWVLQVVAPNAVLVTWWDYSTPLWYRQLILGERPDVSVIDDRTRLDANLGSVDDVIRENLGRRPVYLVRRDEDVPGLEGAWLLDQVVDPGGTQSLLRVVGPRAAGVARATIGP